MCEDSKISQHETKTMEQWRRNANPVFVGERHIIAYEETVIDDITTISLEGEMLILMG